MDVFYYIDVGDEVLDRRDLKRRGRVLAVINDGKLSKTFYVVKWDNGVEETCVLEDLCSLREIEEQERMYNIREASKKTEFKEDIYEEILIGESDEWLKVAASLEKAGLSESEIIQLIKNGKLVAYVNKFNKEIEKVALLVPDGSKVIFKISERLSMPVRKHLDIGEVEKFINEKNQEVYKEEFMKKKSFIGDIVIRKIFDGYGIEFGDGKTFLMSKDDLMNVINEYGLNEKEVLNSLKDKGYYKVSVFDLDLE